MSISIDEAKVELEKLLAKNKLCIFAGSGISVPAPSNLPTWDQFVDKYIDICREVNEMADRTMKFEDVLADAPRYKTKSAVNTLTVLKDKIRFCKKHGMSTTIYDDMMNELFMGRDTNEYHDTIVNTNYKYILTTNYDTLLDKAARHQKHYELLKRSYSYKDLQRISEAIYTGEPAIIHIHGIATEVVLEDFILTADDYKQIRDKNRGLRTLLNILFMNYSMLMVGYGASDPHLEDVIEDINLSFGWFDSDDVLDLPMYYLVIKKDKVSPIFDQLKNRNRTRIIAVDEHEEALALLKHLQAKFPRS